MAIRGGQHAFSTSGGATIVTPAITTMDTKSTFVVWVYWDSSFTFTSIADSKSNTWVEIGTEFSDANLKAKRYYVANGTGGSGHTVTVNLSAGGTGGVFFLEILGAAAASFDSASAASGSDTVSPYTVTSGTLAQADELVVCGIGGNSVSNPATLAESSGFTLVDKQEDGVGNWPGGLFYKVVTATTALTPSFTQSGSASTVLAIFGFKAAPNISVQPASVTSYVPNTATFNLTANGTGTLIYQWKDDGSNVGTNSNSYTTAASTAADNHAAITCDVTDDAGVTVSDPAYWYVLGSGTLAWTKN